MKKILQLFFCITLLLVLSQSDAMENRIKAIKKELENKSLPRARRMGLESELRRLRSQLARAEETVEETLSESEEEREEQPEKRKGKRGKRGKEEGEVPPLPPRPGQRLNLKEIEKVANQVNDLRDEIRAEFDRAYASGDLQEPATGAVYNGALAAK
jgi:hypothetical protein